MSNQSKLMDIEQLIAPIDGTDAGVGEDLTFDPRIDAIHAARSEDDPLLAQGDWVTELKVADWDFVKNQSATLLATTSKDLKLALWYVDALSHTDHLSGIIHGINFLQALNDTYWMSMHPSLDEEDSMDIRAGLYSWFVKTLSEDLKQLPLSDSEHHSYNYNTYLSARNHDKQRQQDPDSQTEGLALSDYHQAIRNSSSNWQQQLVSQLQEMIELWTSLTDQLNELMGEDAPVFAPVSDLLITLSTHLNALLPQAYEAHEQQTETEEQDLTEPNASVSTQTAQKANTSSQVADFSPNNQNHQANRQQALKLLGQIQTYFAVNEPHSPVTFLLKRAIDWADMPLDEWLMHVIKNPEQLSALSDIIGIEKPQDPNQHNDGY